MFEKRIIPILTFMGEDLVKTKNFKNYLGQALGFFLLKANIAV
jgi:hypothetical protein